MSIFVGIDAGGSATECMVERDGARAPFTGAAVNVRTLGVDRAADAIAQMLRVALQGATCRRDRGRCRRGRRSGGCRCAARSTGSGLRTGARRGLRRCGDRLARRSARRRRHRTDRRNRIDRVRCLRRAGGARRRLRPAARRRRLGICNRPLGAFAGAARCWTGARPTIRWSTRCAPSSMRDDPSAMLARIHAGGDPVASMAALAPLIVERASAGERSASKIVQAAALELTDLVKAVVKRADASAKRPSAGICRRAARA